MANLDFGVIGNAVISALIDRNARINWCCFPRPDGDPIFCSLLNGTKSEDGFFDIELDDCVDREQYYLGNTAILITILKNSHGCGLRIIDFAPRFKRHERIFRPPMLVRRLEPIGGAPSIRIRVRPSFSYNSVKPHQTLNSSHIRFIGPKFTIRLTTDAPIPYIANEHTFTLSSPLQFILGPDETIPDSLLHTAQDFQERTEAYWTEWARYLSIPFEWQEVVIRAAITLKLCCYEETGAIVAALTTSIPEAPRTQRNWDYRHCWLRDAYFSVQALNRLGATRTMEDYLGYIMNVVALEHTHDLKPVYGILPEQNLEEKEVPTLQGFQDHKPVRIGNNAYLQQQNDSYGSVILAIAQMFFDRRLPIQGDLALFEKLERLGEKAVNLAFQPDAGLWEFRQRTGIHTHSAALCWAACDRLSKIAQKLDLSDRSKIWNRRAKDIHAEILARAWNEKLGSFVSTLDGENLDASLLLLHEIGFISPKDERFIATVAAITRELYFDGHIYRYRISDDFGTPETTFTICIFWYIDALAAAGKRDEAHKLFEHILTCRNHLGLLSEDFDPKSSELWGNFPQTYSMVGLIICAMRLSKSWEEAFWRGS